MAKTDKSYTYNVLRPQNYRDLVIPGIYEVKFERDFVLFFDIMGVKQMIRNDSINRIERQG